jgi:GNAT superfamily N-acetyltransferase
VGEVTQPLSPPTALEPGHDVSRFDCGKEPLNDWLKERAKSSEGRSARCFVVAQASRVVGYYCTAAGSVEREKLPKKFRRNMPGAVPVVIVGRLAVDKTRQGSGLGGALLKDALLRILGASSQIGARAVLLHALDDDALLFYRGYGFISLPEEPRTLFLPLETVAAAL